jgi:hypothetical protein
MSRVVSRVYRDPLEVVWLEAARRIGLVVERSPHAFASTDGKGTLTIGTAETLDADDSLAQMILHELCHALVQGPGAFERTDWGLDNETDRDLTREHACLRLQADLLAPHGLARVLAPTTEHRAFYDALGPDPLAGSGESATLARKARSRVDRPPFAPHLTSALEATRAIFASARAFAVEGDLGAVWSEPPPRHPAGFPIGASAGSCGSCAWSTRVRGVLRCRPANARVRDEWPACDRFEAELDCQGCSACCRDAYDAVEISRREPMITRHPALVDRSNGRLRIVRAGDRCAALEGSGPYACTIYDDRPRTCREFEVGSDHCLDARRRVGATR